MGNATLYPSRHLGTPRLIAPNAAFAPYEIVHGIRRFHLTAEVIAHELVRGVVIQAWGCNGSIPGPVIVTHEGERIQVALHNRLPEPTAIHWHGLNVPNQVDGVPEIGAGPLELPGQTYVYDFAVPQSGTFMYHAHAHDAKQEMMGLGGMFISLPRHLQTADREFIILLQEWSVRDQAATAPFPPHASAWTYVSRGCRGWVAPTRPSAEEFDECGPRSKLTLCLPTVDIEFRKRWTNTPLPLRHTRFSQRSPTCCPGHRTPHNPGLPNHSQYVY